MMQKLLTRALVSLVLVCFISPSLALAQKIPVLDFFHGRECPHCQEEKSWFPTLKQMYPGIQINEYEVWHDVANQKLWGERLAAFDMTPSAVPTNIIGSEVVVGFSKGQILSLLEKNYGPPAIVEAEVDVSQLESGDDDKNLKILFVLFGAAVLIGGAWFFGQKK